MKLEYEKGLLEQENEDKSTMTNKVNNLTNSYIFQDRAFLEINAPKKFHQVVNSSIQYSLKEMSPDAGEEP